MMKSESSHTIDLRDVYYTIHLCTEYGPQELLEQAISPCPRPMLFDHTCARVEFAFSLSVTRIGNDGASRSDRT